MAQDLKQCGRTGIWDSDFGIRTPGGTRGLVLPNPEPRIANSAEERLHERISGLGCLNLQRNKRAHGSETVPQLLALQSDAFLIEDHDQPRRLLGRVKLRFN